MKFAKYSIDNPVFEPAMFDLSKDPEERNNLFDPSNEHHQNIIDDLKEYKMKLVEACEYFDKTTSPGISINEKTEKLRSLGYIQ